LFKLPAHHIPYFDRTLIEVYDELTYDEDLFDFFYEPSFLDDLVSNEEKSMDTYLLN